MCVCVCVCVCVNVHILDVVLQDHKDMCLTIHLHKGQTRRNIQKSDSIHMLEKMAS